MKALIYRKFGSADELEWADEWPEPELSSNSVLVRVIAGSINPKDVLLRKGKFGRLLAREPLPRIVGLDIAGEIVAVGSEIAGFSVGDAVYGMTNSFSGGVHSEFALLRQNEISHSPVSISMVEAASVPLAAQTALQALRDYCRLKAGQRVLINGASGGVGHFAVQIAKNLGAEVHAVCGPNNVSFVESLGADVTYSYTEQSAISINVTFDAVFDVFGNFSRSQFNRQLGRKGVYVTTVPKVGSLWAECLAKLGIIKTNRFVLVRSRSEDLLLLKDWVDSGLLTAHIDKAYPVIMAGDAHRHVESKHTVGKVCIVFPPF